MKVYVNTGKDHKSLISLAKKYAGRNMVDDISGIISELTGNHMLICFQ
jgi:hypothetical protein